MKFEPETFGIIKLERIFKNFFDIGLRIAPLSHLYLYSNRLDHSKMKIFRLFSPRLRLVSGRHDTDGQRRPKRTYCV